MNIHSLSGEVRCYLSGMADRFICENVFFAGDCVLVVRSELSDFHRVGIAVGALWIFFARPVESNSVPVESNYTVPSMVALRSRIGTADAAQKRHTKHIFGQYARHVFAPTVVYDDIGRV